MRLSLKGSAEYSERLEYAAMAAAQRTDKISQQTAKTLFFPKDLNISATRVSDYYKCPFSYFCKHGLKLFGTDKVQMDARYFGNIAHECLEKIMSREENGKRVYDENFTKKTDEQLAAEVSACADEYIEREMGGAFGKTLTFKFAVERLKRSVTYMAAYFREEMKRSLFLPIAFEYDLTDENGRSALAIQLADTRIQIRGKIDRADIYKSDAGTWLRIVDYKTGRQSFRAEEVYHGLDLQMLIYLLAASTGLRGEYGELRPAGIMYSHIRFVKAEMTPYELEKAEAEGKFAEKTSLARAREYKPDGLMLGDEIMPALNTDNEGIFTIYRLTAKGAVHGASTAKPVSEERLKAMERFALNKVNEMAEKIHGGEIKADPLEAGGVLPCTYCDYKSMCPEPDPKKSARGKPCGQGKARERARGDRKRDRQGGELMAVKWTDEQQRAIETTDRGVVVPAAAGSGKTAVLIERTVRLLADSSADCPAERLLAVTFTKDAANQMKTKLRGALTERTAAESDPEARRWLERQCEMLSLAKISTINSFCLELVKSHLNEFDYRAGIRVADDTQTAVITDEAMAAALEETRREDPQGAELLIDALTNNSDTELSRQVYDFYKFLCSLPFPEDWIEKTQAGFTDGEKLRRDVEIFMYEVQGAVDKAVRCQQQEAQLCLKLGNSESALKAAAADLDSLESVRAAVNAGDYELLYDALEGIKFVTMRKPSEKNLTTEEVIAQQEVFEQIKRCAKR